MWRSSLAQEASEAPTPRIKGSVKASNKKISARPQAKKPQGGVLARHLDMAVAIDAQSRSLEAQYRAISARYATANSITPGSPYVGGLQRNAPAGNLRNYNETEVEAGMPLWLPGQRDAYAATVTTGLSEVEERLALRRLDVAALLRDAWWNAQRAARDVTVARTRVVTAHDIGADMTRRVELGDAAQADALLAKNETLAAETELAQTEGAVKVARVNYMALTGGASPRERSNPCALQGTSKTIRRCGRRARRSPAPRRRRSLSTRRRSTVLMSGSLGGKNITISIRPTPRRPLRTNEPMRRPWACASAFHCRRPAATSRDAPKRRPKWIAPAPNMNAPSASFSLK